MTIAFFSNVMNHHQKYLCDEIYRRNDGHFIFVELIPMPQFLLNNGYSIFSDVPYILRAYESEENLAKARHWAVSADVMIYGGPETIEYAILRAKQTNKLTFEVGERWFKKGYLNLLSPNLIKCVFYYRTLFDKKNFYRLCSSYFAAGDEAFLRAYKDRCYKWGYFTKVDPAKKLSEVETSLEASSSDIIPLMWCSRYLRWKHPELPILVAKRLKEKGYRFRLDMFSNGKLFDKTKKLAREHGVEDVVVFRGAVPNEQILEEMSMHDIFLFTSDQNEGWGAVVNEAMSNGAVVVGSDAIGSVPFLIKDGENGLIFSSSSLYKGFHCAGLSVDMKALDSLTEKVEWLINHPKERNRMSNEAIKTMREVWSTENAAKNLLALIECLRKGLDTPIEDGPCSKALPIIKI